jgi:hypothetical protein
VAGDDRAAEVVGVAVDDARERVRIDVVADAVLVRVSPQRVGAAGDLVGVRDRVAVGVALEGVGAEERLLAAAEGVAVDVLAPLGAQEQQRVAGVEGLVACPGGRDVAVEDLVRAGAAAFQQLEQAQEVGRVEPAVGVEAAGRGPGRRSRAGRAAPCCRPAPGARTGSLLLRTSPVLFRS